MPSLQSSSIFTGLVALELAGRLNVSPARIDVHFNFETRAAVLTFKSEYVQEQNAPAVLADAAVSGLQRELVTVEFKGAVIKVCAAAPCVTTTEGSTEPTSAPPSTSTSAATAENAGFSDAATLATSDENGGLGIDTVIVIAVAATILVGLVGTVLYRRNNASQLKRKISELDVAQDQAAIEMETRPKRVDRVNSKSSMTALMEVEHNTVFTETDLDSVAALMGNADVDSSGGGGGGGGGSISEDATFDFKSVISHAESQGATLGATSTSDYLAVATAWAADDFDDFDL